MHVDVPFASMKVHGLGKLTYLTIIRYQTVTVYVIDTYAWLLTRCGDYAHLNAKRKHHK